MVFKAMAGNTVMTSLGLGGNNLGEEGAEAVAAMVGRNTALRSMSIGNNNLGDAGVEALEDALGKECRLLELDLVNNGTKVSKYDACFVFVDLYGVQIKS